MKHMFLKQCALFVALFGVSGGATLLYFSQTSNTGATPDNNGVVNPNDGNQEITPAEALFMSMTNLKQFNIDGGLDFTYGDDQLQTSIDLKGVADISDFSDVKISADMDIDVSGITVNGKLGYFDSTVYMDYNNSHIKLPQQDALDFVSILPSLGVDVAIPDELANLDLNAISDQLTTMEPIDGPDGERVFQLALNKDIDVFFKATKANQFIGLRTNKFFYEGLYCYADFNIEEIKGATLENPENKLDAPKYQLFTPAFGLIEGMHKVFGGVQNTINLVVDLKKQDQGTLTDVVKLDSDISYDRTNGQVNLNNQIFETSRVHNLNMQVLDGSLYVNHADLNKVSFAGQSVLEAITYLTNQITDEELNALLDKIAGSMNGVDPMPTLEKLMNLNAWIQGTTITENGVDITFDLSAFDPALTTLTISLNKNQDTFTGIHLKDFKFQGLIANVDMVVEQYAMPEIQKAQYVALDPAMTLVQTVYQLTKNKEFRFNINGLVDDSTAGVKDVTIGGNMQFNVVDKFGYGTMNIKDTTNYNHKVQVDYRKDQQILFAYNDATRAKMTARTINDVTGFVSELVQKRDAHFMELFGDIIKMIENTPIYKAITGDYGLLFATPGISNINVTDNIIEMDINGALIGMDDMTMHLAIRYDANNFKLYGLDVTNITMGTQTISFNLDLVDAIPEVKEERLDPYLTYFDLSELKLLLELGYNTTVPDDFHIRGNLSVSLISIINVDLPLDIRIKNNKGNVSIAIDIERIPIIPLVNSNKNHISAKNRSSQYYYQDGYIYARRNDQLSKGRNDTFTSKIGLKEFMETNTLMNYLLSFTLGLWPGYVDQVMNAINTPADPANPAPQMKYELILKDFAYNNYDNYYHVSLNMKELAANPKLNDLNVNIYADMNTRTLNAIQVDWNVVAGVNLKGRIDLIEFGQQVDLSTMNNFITAQTNAPLGEIVETVA